MCCGPPQKRLNELMAQNHSSPGAGPTQRQLRVGELIRRTLSDLLNRSEIHDPDLNRHSITVGAVRMTPDLKVATIFVMPLGGQGVKEAITALARNKYELRRRIAKEMTLKYAPDLRFLPDDTFDRLDDTRRMFENEVVARDVAAGNDDADTGAN